MFIEEKIRRQNDSASLASENKNSTHTPLLLLKLDDVFSIKSGPVTMN